MINDSILLIHSYEYGWDSVRHWLGRWSSGEKQREVTQAAHALAAIKERLPKVILASDSVEGESSYPLLADIRARCGPNLSISVFAGEIDPLSIHLFAQLNPVGFFKWKELKSSEMVATALRLSLTPGLISGTPSIAYTYFQMNRGQDGIPIRPTITSRQFNILRQLTAGHTYETIVRSLNCGRRTVVLEIETMTDALAADNVHDLIMRATIAGLLP